MKARLRRAGPRRTLTLWVSLIESPRQARERSRVAGIVDTGFELTLLFPMKDEEGQHFAAPPEDLPAVPVRVPGDTVFPAKPARQWVRLSDGYDKVDLFLPVYYIDWYPQALIGMQLLSAHFEVSGPPDSDWTLQAPANRDGLALPGLDDRW